MDIKIIRIEPKPGAEIEKDPPGGKNPNIFHCTVIYVCANGQRFEAAIRYSKKRDVAAELATLPKDVNNKVANFRDGRYVGTTTSYSLRGGG